MCPTRGSVGHTIEKIMQIESTCEVSGSSTECVYTGVSSTVVEFGVVFMVWVTVCVGIVLLVGVFTKKK